MVQHTMPPTKSSVIQHASSKNCSQQAVQEQDREALEVVTRFRSKWVVVGYTQVNKHWSAAKNIFRKWKAAAVFVLQPKDDCHTNGKTP